MLNAIIKANPDPDMKKTLINVMKGNTYNTDEDIKEYVKLCLKDEKEC